ncbi:hypothetical protein J6590_084530 [Homalodisca vitripennis]|nr:hypothetical protein J6590_084530 [Homalodisca vitripennis]
MLWASKWYDRYTIDSFFYDEHKVFKGIMLARAIANTTMILVLFFSYNRKQLRFARIHYDLDMIDRNLRLTTKCANATMKIVATCIVYGVALPSISTLLWMIHFHNKNFSFQEQKSSIIHYVCISSMAWAQGVVLFHFNHITQGIAARFLNVTYKIEQVVVGNDSTSLMPYQILVSGSSLATTSSLHLIRGLPLGLVLAGVHSATFFTTLLSFILVRCPSHLIFWALMKRTISSPLKKSSRS